MRIVADTNTVISGLLYGGFPQEIINAARAKRITLYSSVTLIAELAEVIVREKFARQIRAARVSAPEVVADYAQLARIVVPAEIRPTVPGDGARGAFWTAFGNHSILLFPYLPSQ